MLLSCSRSTSTDGVLDSNIPSRRNISWMLWLFLRTDAKYNDLMFQVLGWRKQANPTDQYPEQTDILEQVTSLRRTLNLDSKNYLVDHSQQDWPGGQETAGQLRRSEGRQAREREGPERTHSRRPSGVLRWGLSCSPQQQVGRCLFNSITLHE